MEGELNWNNNDDTMILKNSTTQRKCYYVDILQKWKVKNKVSTIMKVNKLYIFLYKEIFFIIKNI